jgi:hypothetical protein
MLDRDRHPELKRPGRYGRDDRSEVRHEICCPKSLPALAGNGEPNATASGCRTGTVKLNENEKKELSLWCCSIDAMP